MSTKLTDLAEKLGLTAAELKDKIVELGFELKPRARTVEDDVAALVEDELAAKKNEELDADAPAATDNVTQYEEYIEDQLDKEIIKSQRKMMAGKPLKAKKPGQDKAQVVMTDKDIEIPDQITVKEFSEKTGISPIKVIGELMKNGIMANINQSIDFDTATILADEFSITIKRKRSEAAVEDISTGNLQMLLDEKDKEDLQERPPVVTIMGHVDHGKTSLLDAIRETSVVSGEAGGITQHIGAYQVEKDGRKITFIDTPGHEAFTSMRARGAKITDIVILVVAADEGIKPQTVEALNHARAAEVPIIVAVNKIDKEGANLDKVKSQLAEEGLQPEDWGGQTIMVPVSALTGQGLDNLLEMILLTADLNPLKANPNRPGVATILESHLDPSLGPVATVLINTGTLRTQDPFIVGSIYGRVKLMRDDLGKPIDSALPSTPVRIAGLQETPKAGDILQVVASMDEARRKADQISLLRDTTSAVDGAQGLDSLMTAIQEGRLKHLKVVLKADTLGTLEAVKRSLEDVRKDEVSVKVILGGVGALTESDIMMAAATEGGIALGFNVPANAHVRDVADRNGVQLFTYSIIYQLIDDMKKILSGMLEAEVNEVILGKAEIKAVFLTQKKAMIIGCKVTEGKIENKSRVRVFRGGELVGEGVIGSLKRVNDVVKEIEEGHECGVRFEGDTKLEAGDILESWKLERRERVL
ncbi:translation initiation factor IF-2 [Candidatus Peregrinibacteria bacterium CG_4_9_14_0_2_um_filter_53_11]|nr:MAG: translation initiation factor IF-2 [Candidatus Peregrinibacteria bacterium CG_4_9_14_0_2_um_filter_53_11]